MKIDSASNILLISFQNNMKQLLITIAALVLVGCGESQQSATAPEPNSEPPTTEVSDISLIVAAEDGNIEAVKQNLAEGVDVNTRSYIGESPLHGAATFGHKEIVELLIAKGADVNAKGGIIDGTTPLHKSASNGHWEVAEVLIAKGADVNAKVKGDEWKGSTPLDYAIRVVSTKTANLLRKHGAKTGEELKAEGR